MKNNSTIFSASISWLGKTLSTKKQTKRAQKLEPQFPPKKHGGVFPPYLKKNTI